MVHPRACTRGRRGGGGDVPAPVPSSPTPQAATRSTPARSKRSRPSKGTTQSIAAKSPKFNQRVTASTRSRRRSSARRLRALMRPSADAAGRSVSSTRLALHRPSREGLFEITSVYVNRVPIDFSEQPEYIARCERLASIDLRQQVLAESLPQKAERVAHDLENGRKDGEVVGAIVVDCCGFGEPGLEIGIVRDQQERDETLARIRIANGTMREAGGIELLAMIGRIEDRGVREIDLEQLPEETVHRPADRVTVGVDTGCHGGPAVGLRHGGTTMSRVRRIRLVVWKMGTVLVHIDEIRSVTFELLAHHLERFEVQRGRGRVLDHHELVDPLRLFDGHIILKATSVLVFGGLCVDVHGPEAGLSGVLPDERVCSHRVDQVVSGTSKPENGVRILAAVAARRCQAEIGYPVP